MAEAQATEVQATEPARDWEPPAPDEDADDWIRLTSGEWLRGEILVLRSDNLEFDSAELDELDIDWSDVAEVRATRVMTIGLVDRRSFTGTLAVKDGEVLLGGETTLRFRREELLAIIPGTPRERNYWSARVAVGSTVRRGNTDQTDGNADFRVLRRTPGSRIELKYNGAYTRVSSVETSNYHRLNGKWNIFLSRAFYLTPFFFEGFQDRFQNIDLRFTPGAGAGYTIVDRSALEWDVDGGVGYQVLRYDTVEPGQPEQQNSGAFLLGTTLNTDITKDLEFEFNYSAQAAVSSAIGTNHHARGTFSIDLIGDLELDLSLIWDFVGKPVADSDGVVPKNSDYRFQIGFGWEF